MCPWASKKRCHREDKKAILREALRVTRTGGIVIFSSYSDQFWPYRLSWFKIQAAEGLIGAIDYDATGDGTIVCIDGLHLGQVMPNEFKQLCSSLGMEPEISEVDDSSVFCEIIKTTTV